MDSVGCCGCAGGCFAWHLWWWGLCGRETVWAFWGCAWRWLRCTWSRTSSMKCAAPAEPRRTRTRRRFLLRSASRPGAARPVPRVTCLPSWLLHLPRMLCMAATRARQRLDTVENPVACEHPSRMKSSCSCQWLRRCRHALLAAQVLPMVAMGKCSGIKPGQARPLSLRVESAAHRTTLARWNLRAWRWKRSRNGAGWGIKMRRRRRRRKMGRPSAPSGRVWSTSYHVPGAEPQLARGRGGPRRGSV